MIVGLLAAVVLGQFYWQGAVRNLENINTDMTSMDQSAYMAFTKRMYARITRTIDPEQSAYPITHDGARMVIYPFLQLLSYDPNESDQQFFHRGKYLNIVLSLVLIVGLWFIFRRYLSISAAVPLLLITAFSVFWFKSAYFQPELLFFFLFFIAYIFMHEMISNPYSWRLAMLTGCVIAIAQHTKYSMLLGFAVFLCLFACRMAWNVLYKRTFTHAKREAITFFIVIASFFTLMLPHIIENEKKFGVYFYNVDAVFYMWYDTWDEAKRGTRAHDDRTGWPDMPEEELPTMGKYFSEHTTEQILRRISKGLSLIRPISRSSYGWYKYFLIYSFVAIAFSIYNLSWLVSQMKKKVLHASFTVAFFAAYFSIISWYLPFSSGDRFVLVLFLPVMFSLGFYIEKMPVTRIKEGVFSLCSFASVFHIVVSVLILYDIFFVLNDSISTIYGGR